MCHEIDPTSQCSIRTVSIKVLSSDFSEQLDPPKFIALELEALIGEEKKASA